MARNYTVEELEIVRAQYAKAVIKLSKTKWQSQACYKWKKEAKRLRLKEIEIRQNLSVRGIMNKFGRTYWAGSDVTDKELLKEKSYEDKEKLRLKRESFAIMRKELIDNGCGRIAGWLE